MKQFFANKKADFYILSATVVLGILGIILYAVTATDKSQMTETFVSGWVIALFAIAVASSCAAMFLEFPLIRTLGSVAYFATILAWAINQGGYIVNVMMGIDGNVFSFGYILAVIIMLLGFIASIVSGVMLIKRQEATKVEKAE